MTILDKIIAAKRVDVERLKAASSIRTLEKMPLFERNTISLESALLAEHSSGIIAEYKRKSPSKGLINGVSTISEVTEAYLNAGVAAQSILTDTDFFGGLNTDLSTARVINKTHPILRKDFVVDEFQIVESKALGADVILLIAACLTGQELKDFGALAGSLGLSVLYEVHNQEELDKIELENKIIGINNRNLKTFEVDLEHSIQLASQIPDSCIKVSESGISSPQTILDLKKHGFKGFLIGENFMKTSNPGNACQSFIKQIR